jgi:HEAT repeat protein
LDEENLHRLVALQAISSLGPDAKPAARRVEALVNDSDKNLAKAARLALEYMGVECSPKTGPDDMRVSGGSREHSNEEKTTYA